MKYDVEISVIVPVYNVSKYLEKCLESIRNQTFKDFEVICINDGSTDNSLEILNKYAEDDKRFVVVSQENQGQGAARNNALKMARGKYIVFVDPDDWIELNMLEELIKAFEQTKAEVVEFNRHIYYDSSNTFKAVIAAEIYKEKFNYDLNLHKYYSLEDVNVNKSCFSPPVPIAVWKRAYSREFLERIQAVCAPTKYAEDQLFSYIVLLNAERIYYIDKYLYTYRNREKSASRTISDGYFCIFENIQLFKKYLTEHNLYNKFEDEFREYQFAFIKQMYCKIPENSRKRYNDECRKYLTPQEYKKYKKLLRWDGYSFGECIFSVKNKIENEVKHKVITVFGIKFKFFTRAKKKLGGGKIYFSYWNGRNNLGDIFNIDLMNFFNCDYVKLPFNQLKNTDLIAVGSIFGSMVTRSFFKSLLNKFKPSVKVWGTGFMKEKTFKKEYFVRSIEIFALRGKYTLKRCETILNKKLSNIVLADPGLLFSVVFPINTERVYDVGIIPHYSDKNCSCLNNIKLENLSYNIIDIEAGVENTLKELNKCRFILSSSLHGLIAADSYNIPNKWIKLEKSLGEYKFKDYYSAYDISDEEPIDLKSQIITDSDIETLKKQYRIDSSCVRTKIEELIKSFPFKNRG